MNTTITQTVKVTGAVLAIALALFFGYSVTGYVADSFASVYAGGDTNGGGGSCGSCGGGFFWTSPTYHINMQADGGGGGGGYTPSPYCTLSITRGPAVGTSYPPQYQYTVTWAAPYATQFTIDFLANSYGPMTPPTGGTYTFSSSSTSGTIVGTAVTPYGTVQCSGQIPPPPPNPPYCVLTASPTTIAAGQSSTITWNTTSGVSFSVNNGVGSLTPVGGGTFVVSPATTTTYIGTVIGSGYQTAQCQTTIVVTDPPKCELEISKVANKTKVAPGEYIEYTITFKNRGSAKCTGSGVKVQDVLDPLLIYQSETHSTNVTPGYQSEPVHSNRVVVFNAWDLDPNESGWVKIKVKAGTPTACSTVVPNYATISSYEYDNFNSWVSTQPATNVTIEKDCAPKKCELEITKGQKDISSIAPGNTHGYLINVKNVGDAKCTGSGVKIQDTLDPLLTYVAETHSSNITAGYQSEPVYNPTTRTVSWNAWDLDPGETGWVGIEVTVGTPSACEVWVKNKARITSYEYNNFQTWVYSNEVKTLLKKDCAPKKCELEITKSANVSTTTPGGQIEYTINVENKGDAKCTGSGVKIQDVLDSRLTYVSETHSANITAGYQALPVYQSSTRTLSWNAWDLDPSETGWIKVKVTAGTPSACTETIPNKAKVTSYEYDNFGTWVYSNIVNISVTKDCYQPVPYCTMSIDPTSIDSGQSATITWNTTNVTSASIDQGVGTVALSGTKIVNPTANTTYTGTFTGPGGTVTCQASITVRTHNPVPQCTLSVSASKIKSGQSVIVSWTSQNVSQGFINMVGTTTPVFGGSAEVFPSNDTTFTGTFTGSYGTVTCSAPVTVEKGTTGCQGNCGGGLNQPNVVMLQKPPEAPLAFVTLEQIPYTGFEAGKALTLAFWLAVGLLAAAITYFAMGRDMLKVAVGAAPTPWNNNAYAGLDEEVREAPRHMPNVMESVAAPVYMPPVQVAPVAPTAVVPHVMPMPQATRPVVDGIPDLADVIESRAHGAGVLMSPEAVALALKLSTDRAEALRQFGEILNTAIQTLPREDGWVMLTSERFEDLSGKAPKPVTMATPVSTPSVEAILNSVMPPVLERAPANVEMPMASADDQAVVMSLAQAILAGNREQAYTVLKNLEQGGARPASVMTVIAGAYDQLYRARRHGLTTELSVVAMPVSDEALMKLVEIFTHGMDAVYANPFTGLKLAVAQAFEARA